MYPAAMRHADNHDVDQIISTTLLADVLSTSHIFKDLLELAGDWLPGGEIPLLSVIEEGGHI